jgi:hypothetical protein
MTGFSNVASRRTSDEGPTKHKAKFLVASKNLEKKKTESNLNFKISKTEGEPIESQFSLLHLTLKKITLEKEKKDRVVDE